MSVVYVSPSGQDRDEGTANFPYRTLTRALQDARPGMAIQVAVGTYREGEVWPLVVPAGVTVVGAASQPTIIEGGGENAQSNGEHVAIVLDDRAQLRNFTIKNTRGSGLFTKVGMALVVNSQFVDCAQYGVIASDRARPFISNSSFTRNSVAGLKVEGRSKGEVRQNQFEQNGTGIIITGSAAPLLVSNKIVDSRYGIVLQGVARPVIRKNNVVASQSALRIKDRANPDIGHPQDLGNNSFVGIEYDLYNEAATLSTAGNQINPIRVHGSISYQASQLPDDIAVPPVLLGNVEPQPDISTPERDRTDSTPNLDSRFNDLVGHWSAPFVEALADKNLVKGFIDGTFRPDIQVTRAQFAALVAAAFADQKATRSDIRFKDVSASLWAAQAIRYAQTRGFISGFPDGSFRPNDPMTRVQALVALANGLALSGGRSESLLAFTDRAQVPSYAVEPVAAATELRIVVNYPNPSLLRPLSPITRAETTALVHQALVASDRADRIASPYIPRTDVASANFVDLSADHWAKDFIEPMVQKGWLSGFSDGTFQPEAPMTRAQFAALLVGAFEPTPKRPAQQFRDVNDDFWAANVIQQAYRAKFISGFPDLTFDPNYPLTKLQALLALVSGLSLRSVSAPNVRSLQVFSDRSAIPSYAESAVATAAQLGLVFNRPNLAELRPNRTATRAEVCAMVYQALHLQGEMPAINSADRVSVNSV